MAAIRKTCVPGGRFRHAYRDVVGNPLSVSTSPVM